MERLTRKSLEYKDTWIADGSLSNIEGVVRGNAIDRLAEFEDFMEEMDFESLEHLAFTLEEQNKIIEAYEQENQALKDFNSRLQNINIELLNQKQILLDRWQKLKEFAKIEHDWGLDENYQDHSYAMKLVFDRMEELEKE